MSEILTPRSELAVAVLPAPPQRLPVGTARGAREAMRPARFAAPGKRARDLNRWKTENYRENGHRSIADMERYEAGSLPMLGQLWARKVERDGETIDLGLISCRVVTNVGVAFIVDAWQNLVELETMRYHGVGTGTTAEAASQTALTTELTTQYSTSNTRPTGTLGEQSGVSNAFESSATITVSSAVAITEHGLFSQAATGGGVIMDRSVFSAINLASGESLQVTWRLTFPSGG